MQARQRALAVERDGALKGLLPCLRAGRLALLVLAPVAAALVGGGQRAAAAVAGSDALGALGLLPLPLVGRQQRQLALGEGAAAPQALLAGGLQEGLRAVEVAIREERREEEGHQSREAGQRGSCRCVNALHMFTHAPHTTPPQRPHVRLGHAEAEVEAEDGCEEGQ